MNIRTLLSHLRPPQAQHYAKPAPAKLLTGLPNSGSRSDAVRVTLSPASRMQAAPSAAELEKAAEMRALLGKYDFRNVTPREMALLANKLSEGYGELSREAIESFIGIEKNLVAEIDPDTRIDMVAHFDRMLAGAQQANTREPGYFDFTVQYRQLASKTLSDVMSFAASDRLHIAR